MKNPQIEGKLRHFLGEKYRPADANLTREYDEARARYRRLLPEIIRRLNRQAVR